MGAARASVRRVFVANRGEIAVRIVDACRKLGFESVIGTSTADRESLGARRADRAICIGPAAAAGSYLQMRAIVAAALGTGCDAVHPGYGFLSERAEFQRLCSEHGLRFVGPSAAAMDAVGDKLNARRIAATLGIPTVPGTGAIANAEAVLEFARQCGYPVLLKASAGGGGRGMRVVRAPDEVATAFTNAASEARAAFGDPTLFVERFVERARHIEIQVIADADGNVVHLGERDCTTQRRHQKLIEESPSPVITAETRMRMGEAAVRLARHVRYCSAGTVEFILDGDTGEFYFLEVNARIQVEHPVTEMVTGIDLVCEQLNVAFGQSLLFGQDDVAIRGHAIECRINAESPEREFAPSPGRLAIWQPPAGPHIRVDTHCYPGYFVPPFYDSMVAKLVVHGEDRDETIRKMVLALSEFDVEGIDTTIPFHKAVLGHSDFRNNRITTRWVEEKFMNDWRTSARTGPFQ